MVGGSAYVQGTSVEYAIDGAGGYEGVQTAVCPVPGGYHFRSLTSFFGFVSNPQVNGWATFDGDFFTPGTPENGWGIEIIDGANDFVVNNNCYTTVGMTTMPGSITGYVVNGLCRIVTWEGDYINGAYNVHVKMDYVLMTPDLYYTTVLTITNNGANISDFYFHRNFDPDNNVSINGLDFSTQNTIVSQPGAGCNKAHVRATSTNPGTQPMSYVGLAGVGANWRASYGGFSNRDASDIWNGIGVTQASGSTNTADQAISLAYRIQNFAPATTQQFRFVVILDDLAANNAVNNLFTMTWPGAPVSTSTQCNPVTDTITICNGSSTPISVQGSALADFNWSWTPTVGLSPTTGSTVTASPTTSTLYTVTGTPINPCFNPVTQQIYVRVVAGSTTANAGPNTTITCTTPSVVLGGLSSGGGATYNWTGPGVVSGGTTLTPTVNLAGVYTLTATIGGCAASDTMTVVANNLPPNSAAGLDQILTCTTTSINLSGSSSTPGVTCAWTGPGITAGNTTWTPTVNAVGNYTVTVTNPANGCTSTDLAAVTLNNTPPNANAGPDMILNCAITSVNLSGSSSTPGVTFAWAGPGITAGGATASPTVNAPGTYTVTTTDPTNGCTSTDVADVTGTSIIPNANAGIDMTLTCVVTSLNLAGSSSTPGVTYAWMGPGITAGATTTTPTVNLLGTYTLTVTDPSNGCTNTDVADVTQNIIPPGANAGLDDVLNCVVLNLNLSATATVGGATFVWAGPSIVSGGTTSNPNINGPGTYTVTATDPVNGCTSTDMVDITLNNTLPNVTMGTDQNILCNTPIVNLSGGSTTPGATFVWAGAGIVGSSTNANVDANVDGTYTVTVTDPANGCTSTGTVDAILDLNYPTALFFADNLTSCAPLCATLSDNSLINGSPIVGWHWEVESQGTADVPSGTFCFNNPGTYDVTLTVTTSDGCTSTLTIPNYLTVHPNPLADFMYTPQEITEFDPLVIFGNASIGADTYFWDFGDGSTSSLEDPNHLYSDTGVYCITLLTNTNFGCTDTITHCLHVAPEFNVFIPNSFTVNEDGLNETWNVIGRGVKTFEARIFDRWGEELFFFDNIDKGWNGTRQNGNLCQQGVYVYRVLIMDGKGDFHEYIGNVNLIR